VSRAVLAIRLRALGDVVLTTPALRALKRAAPDTRLEVVTDERYVPLIETLPEIDRVWGLPRSSGATVALISELRRRHFALVVDFFGNPRSALVARWCGARRRAGFDVRGRRHAYQVRVPRDAPAADGGREHASAAHLRLAVAVGGVPDGEPPRLTLSAAARAEADALLSQAGVKQPERTVGLVAAGTWNTKTWPASHAVGLARRLSAHGWPLILISGPGEEAVTATLTELVPGLAVLPRCGVATLAAVIARLRALVGTDSGPRHIAAALGVATFAWFGPTHPDTWQPAGPLHGFWQTPLPCRGCDRTHCSHWNCLPGLDPEQAAMRVVQHLEGVSGSAAAFGPAAGA
jgi:ADP-heptose:LPS heptosyltransferase